MLSSVFKGFGGLLGDTVEAVKYIGEEIMEVPGAIADGFEEGLITSQDKPEEATKPEAVQSANTMTEEAEEAQDEPDARDDYITELEAKLKASEQKNWK